jgi:hypothetical protein
MEGREHEVSSFSESDRCSDRLEVSHLTYDDHIWIFTKD